MSDELVLWITKRLQPTNECEGREATFAECRQDIHSQGKVYKELITRL